MTHLGERVADYVLGEMSGSDKTAVESHLRGCAECSTRVEEFQRTFAMLRTVPDVEPPRRIVFEAEKRPAEPWFWKWMAPAFSAVAASLLTAFFLSPAAPPPAAQTAEIVRTPAPAVVSPAPAAPTASAPDVQALVAEVKASNERWLAAELDRRDKERNLEIQRVRGEMAYWESQQRASSRESFETVRSIQLLAQRLPSENR